MPVGMFRTRQRKKHLRKYFDSSTYHQAHDELDSSSLSIGNLVHVPAN